MFVQKLTLVSVVLFAAVLAVGAVIAGNRPGGGPDKPPTAKDPDAARQAPIVKLVQPQPGGLDRTTSQPCTAEAAQRVDLFPSAAGIIKALVVDIGDRVKRGQVLLEIDAPNLVIEQRQAQLGVKQAQAGVLEAVARVSIAKAEVEAAQSVVRQRQAEAEAARALAAYRKKQLDRMKELLNQKAIDQHIVDEAIDHYTAAKGQEEAAQAAVESAKADTAVKKSRFDQAEAAVNSARANVEAAELAVEKARFALDHTIIRAPFDGVITFRGYSVGELVRAEGPAAGRDPLLTIVQANMLRIVVEVPERDVPLVAVGTPAEIRFDAQPGMTVSGKVSRIAFTENPKTRTMRVEIDVPNADGKLHPGMFGAARLLLGKGPAGALRVPASAVLTLLPPLGNAKSNAAVYVYRNGKAVMTRVQVAAQSEAEAEILSGLTANDRVVVDPKLLLPKDDVPVQVEPASEK